jgi:predicted CXXCH cytochrome family protein
MAKAKNSFRLRAILRLGKLLTDKFFSQDFRPEPFTGRNCPMRKRVNPLVCLAILASASSGTVEAVSIAGTKHDLSGKATKPGDQDPCLYCHSIHNSDAQLPLWGRTGTSTQFTLYASPSMNATMAQPDGISLGCLSCHDGVTAFDALLGSTGAASGNNMNSNFTGSPAIMGSDLSGEHPVGVDITEDGAGIESEAAITGAGLRIYNNRVECGSCHDPHGTAGYPYFLRQDPSSGSLCETCHIK